MFNSVLLRRDLCCWTKGVQIRYMGSTGGVVVVVVGWSNTAVQGMLGSTECLNNS